MQIKIDALKSGALFTMLLENENNVQQKLLTAINQSLYPTIDLL